MRNDMLYFSRPEILDNIEFEYINQKTHPEFYYTQFRKGRCSPLCDGHCLKFVVMEQAQEGQVK